VATAITVSERHVLVSPGKTAPRGEGYVVSSRDRHPTPSILPKPLLRAKVVQALHTALADRQLRARLQADLLLRRVRPRRAARPALRPPFGGCLPRGLGRCLLFYCFWISDGDIRCWARFLLPGYPAVFLPAAAVLQQTAD